ncbi:diaphanous protein [Mobiluncus mulieris]|uniref:diaphanous protein n=1 Tax=Mobiluncus mulieris TaxID=2052 RepID=UPI00242ECB33|nr:diaphanous protein [Mobiluncus mulieris]
MGDMFQPNSGFPGSSNLNQVTPQVPPVSLNMPPQDTSQTIPGINPSSPDAYGYPPYEGQVPFPAASIDGDNVAGYPAAPSTGQGYPQTPPVPYPNMGQGLTPGQYPVPPSVPAFDSATPSRRYSDEPMDVRKVAQLAEEQHPDLVDLRTRVPFNMPGLVPASVSRSSRRKSRQANAQDPSVTSNANPGGFTLPGDPNAALSFKELLGQPVSNVAASTIASPKELEDSDGLQFRAVGLSVGSVPEPDIRYPIPYIAREHPSYYTGYEVSLIMESIRDPEHARQVLARIVAVPRWVRWVISIFCGVCGAAVSALNAFLSLIAFMAVMTVVLMFTYAFASRIGSGRFYDPTGYKTIWLGAFMPIGLLSATIVARSLISQPWLSLIAFVVTTFCGIIWTTWIQEFQIKRLLSSEIQDASQDQSSLARA